MTENEKKLRSALIDLLDSYVQYTDNACTCEDYNDDKIEDECPYCYAQRVLDEIEQNEK